MNKAILCVDCQIDFINGSLPVEGAENKMNKLAYHLHKHDGDYLLKMFTTDWHPFHHISFKENGGQWPIHCVQNSEGAAIWFPIIKEAANSKGANIVLRKGDSQTKEEYSIFDNLESANKIRELMNKCQIDELSICGLAGDICVAETIKGAIKEFGKDKIKVLAEYSPSLDGGEKLKQLIEDNGLNAEFEEVF